MSCTNVFGKAKKFASLNLLKMFLCVCVYTQGQHLFWNNLFEIYEHNCTAERALVGMGETGAWTHIFFEIYEHTFHVHFQNLGACIRKSKHPCFQCPNEVPDIVTRYFMRLTLCAHMTQKWDTYVCMSLELLGIWSFSRISNTEKTLVL